MPSTPTTLAQLTFAREKWERLHVLMAECGLATPKDYLNQALALFEWTVQQRRQGWSVGALSPDGARFQEAGLAALPCVRQGPPAVREAGIDPLVAQMNKPKAKKAATELLKATPKELGRSSVRAARGRK